MTPPRASVLLCALASVLASCSTANPTPSAVATTPSRNAVSAPLLPTTVEALPTYDATTFADLLGQVKGTPTVVYIWASYCLPCRDEVPLLVAAHARVGDRIQFVGIDDRDARESAIRFLHTFGVAYPNLFDPSGALAVGYGLIGPPGAFFYGADGTLVASVPGQLSAQDLADHLAQIDPGSP